MLTFSKTDLIYRNQITSTKTHQPYRSDAPISCQEKFRIVPYWIKSLMT